MNECSYIIFKSEFCFEYIVLYCIIEIQFANFMFLIPFCKIKHDKSALIDSFTFSNSFLTETDS